MCYAPDSNLRGNAQNIHHKIVFENYTFKITVMFTND